MRIAQGSLADRTWIAHVFAQGSLTDCTRSGQQRRTPCQQHLWAEMKHSLATGALNALGAQRTETSTSLLPSHRNEGGRHRRSRSPHVSNSETERTTKPTNPSVWRLAEPRGTRSAVKQLARMTRGFARQVFHRGKKIFDRSYNPLRECPKLKSAAPHQTEAELFPD